LDHGVRCRFDGVLCQRIEGALIHRFLVLALSAILAGQAHPAAAEAPARSPWLAVPIVSSDPKVGTALGGLAGYLHQFDAKSPVSTFGAIGNYSTTDSYTAGVFTKAFFRGDTHRVTAAVFAGKIRNDYEDFLGSGLPLQTTDDLRMTALRYLRRLSGSWFVGAQAIATNYTIIGESALADKILDLLGLTGFDSNGVGAVLLYDSRDHQESPSGGRTVELSNLAYRRSLGGDESFDAYAAKLRQYWSHGQGHVVALRAQGRWTNNAPKGGFSSLDLRAYVRGNYLAPSVTTLEVEERYRIAERWAVAGFAGTACLYDGLSDCQKSRNWYPALGGGIIFTVKPSAKMVLRLDYAVGKDDNSGLYLSFGHPF
jgi:hypothetical protein